MCRRRRISHYQTSAKIQLETLETRGDPAFRPGKRLGRSNCGQFLNPRDVDKRAFDGAPYYRVLIGVDPHFNCMAFYHRDVVISDVELLAVRQVNAERLERNLIQAILEVQCRKHAVSLCRRPPNFKRAATIRLATANLQGKAPGNARGVWSIRCTVRISNCAICAQLRALFRLRCKTLALLALPG
jgi:hypothetical protein